MKVTLAKALKLKNRLASKMSTISSKIYEYNSIYENGERPVDINALMEKRAKIQDVLINLKTAINAANAPIQATIYLLAELKGENAFLSGVDTTNGEVVERGYLRDSNKTYKKESILDFNTVQNLMEQNEIDIDKNQDNMDKHNHTTEIDVDDSVFDLLRG